MQQPDKDSITMMINIYKIHARQTIDVPLQGLELNHKSETYNHCDITF